MENVTTFKDLYTRDYNLTDIYAERQKWVDGALFKREYPRQCNGIIFLNGCSGKYTDKSGESFLRSMRAKVPLNIERKMDMAKKNAGKQHNSRSRNFGDFRI